MSTKIAVLLDKLKYVIQEKNFLTYVMLCWINSGGLYYDCQNWSLIVERFISVLVTLTCVSPRIHDVTSKNFRLLKCWMLGNVLCSGRLQPVICYSYFCFPVFISCLIQFWVWQCLLEWILQSSHHSVCAF
jgi:hypothetical protein